MGMNFVTFNQDHSLLAVGTSKGFKIYYTDPFALCFEEKDGNVAILEMLFSTSLVALILSPRLLRIQNTKRGSTICELTFPTRVLAVRLNRRRLVVVLEETIYLYDISNMKLLETIATSTNPLAICALSPSSDHNYLIYPIPPKVATQAFAPPSHAPPQNHTRGPPTSGELMVYDASKMEPLNVIEAHQTPLSSVALNSEGTLLATASEKGTVIRVFSLPDVRKLYQFRRGTIPARIYSMSFNATSTLLCVSSASETVHIFHLNPQSQVASPQTPPEKRPGDDTRRFSATSASSARSLGSPLKDDAVVDDPTASPTDPSISGPGERKPLNPTLASMIRRTSQNVGKSFATTVGGYLPKNVTEMWEPQRDFAWVKIPRSLNKTRAGGQEGDESVSSRYDDQLSEARRRSSRKSGSFSGNESGSGPLRTVVAMNPSGPQIMVVTSEGNLFYFSVDLEKGGEGTLWKQVSVLGNSGQLAPSRSDD